MAAKGRTPLWGASLSWQSLNVLLQVILQLVYIRILAELLTQEDFGVMAIALIVVGVVEILRKSGLVPRLCSSTLSPNTSHPHGGSVPRSVCSLAA